MSGLLEACGCTPVAWEDKQPGDVLTFRFGLVVIPRRLPPSWQRAGARGRRQGGDPSTAPGQLGGAARPGLGLSRASRRRHAAEHPGESARQDVRGDHWHVCGAAIGVRPSSWRQRHLAPASPPSACAASIGAAAGGLIGGAVDYLTAPDVVNEAESIAGMQVKSSAYGQPMAQLFPPWRLAGNIIWMGIKQERRSRNRAAVGKAAGRKT